MTPLLSSTNHSRLISLLSGSSGSPGVRTRRSHSPWSSCPSQVQVLCVYMLPHVASRLGNLLPWHHNIAAGPIFLIGFYYDIGFDYYYYYYLHKAHLAVPTCSSVVPLLCPLVETLLLWWKDRNKRTTEIGNMHLPKGVKVNLVSSLVFMTHFGHLCGSIAT